MNQTTSRTYLHVDLDAFFASVEQREHPEYRGKPLIVGGLPTDKRSVVSTASYEARKYGVHSAMSIQKAYQLCPQGIFVRGNYALYSEVSRQIMEIFSRFSPEVIQMSIDEAFIDITGTQNLFGPPEELAKKLQKAVLDETHLTVSVGIANTMYVAKIASGYKKPAGLTHIKSGDETKFMLSLPLEKLWGAGAKTQEHLKTCGFKTTKDIYLKSKGLLISIFGDNMGNFLYNAVRGNKDLNFGAEAKNHSISSERTFEFDLTDSYIIETAIMELAELVLWRMHSEKVRSKTIFVKIRYEDFTTVSIQHTGERFITNLDDFFERAKELFYKKYEFGRGIRLLGIGCDKLESKDIPIQGELFETANEKKAKLEKAIFDMENKNPALKIRKARLLK